VALRTYDLKILMKEEATELPEDVCDENYELIFGQDFDCNT